MKKKYLLPIKWMLGILIILIAVACWTNQQTQNNNHGVLSASSNLSSQNNFFQFLTNLLGIRSQNSPSGQESNGSNNSSNQNKTMPTQGNSPSSGNTATGSLISETASNAGASQGTELNAEQGANSENSLGINAENNSEFNAENPSGMNAEDNLGVNQGINADNPSEVNAETNAESTAGENAETTQGNGPDNTSGNSPGGSSGGDSGNTPTGPGCYEGCYPQCSPGCAWDINPSSLNNPSNPSNSPVYPTINPIPSNNAASQNIAQQNQQRDTLAALVAAQQELARQVLESAQASKYQTVTADSIPPVDTTPAPQDIVDKIKSGQLIHR